MKRINALLGIALLLVSALSIGLLLDRQQGRFSAHKWHEGYAEEVVFDVMENHVYPGVSVSEVEQLLGSGIELTDEDTASLFDSLGIRDVDGLDVFLYRIRENGSRRLAFAVVHNSETVVKTMLVDSMD